MTPTPAVPRKSPNPQPAGVDRNTVATFMAQVALTEKKVLSREPDKAFNDSITRVQLGLFRLVVMGEIKKGKSSFINALCGIPGLVPVHSDVATSTVFKIRHGKELRYTVYFQKDDSGTETKKVITPAELADYGTETGNPDNWKKVDFIAVEAPSAILSNGLIILDTPGVGGLYAKHREITYRHAPSADAIFFVTDSVESPIGREEVAFLKELKKVTTNITFVQTKSEGGAEAVKKRMTNNLGILRESAGFTDEQLRYFCISSKLKTDGDTAHDLEDFKDSGFDPLMRYLQNTLIERKEINICYTAMKRTGERLAILENEVSSKRRLSEADTEEKRSSIQQELNTAQVALRTWESEKQPMLLNEFARALGELKTNITTSLNLKIRPTGELAEAAEAKLASCANAKMMYDLVRILVADARSGVSQALLASIEELRNETTRLTSALAQKAGSQLALELGLTHADVDLSHTSQASLTALAAKAQKDNFFEAAKTGMYGGMAGVAMASIVGGIVGSVVPVVGTIIGSTIGMAVAGIWGGSLTLEHREKQQAEQARREIMAFINQILSGASVAATAELSKAATDFEFAARDAIRRIITETKQQLDSRVKDLAQRRHQTEAQLAQERKTNETAAAALQQLRQQEKALLAKLSV
jgi:hypothetical protein